MCGLLLQYLTSAAQQDRLQRAQLGMQISALIIQLLAVGGGAGWVRVWVRVTGVWVRVTGVWVRETGVWVRATGLCVAVAWWWWWLVGVGFLYFLS